MTPEACKIFFKSSARSAGSRLFAEGKVSFSQPSALEISAYVKPNFKVGLKLQSIQDQNLNASCNCPQSTKGELCKHIWAACLAVFEKSPDYFESVREITKNSPLIRKSTPQSEAQTDAKAAF